MAAALRVRPVPLPIAPIVEPAAIPGPEMGMPTARPAVLVTVTAVEPEVVEAPPMNMPPAPKVSPVPAVPLALRTKVVALVTDATVVPAGTFAP